MMYVMMKMTNFLLTFFGFLGAAITPRKFDPTRTRCRKPSTSKFNRDAENTQACQNLLSIYIHPFQKCKEIFFVFFTKYHNRSAI